jgi:hypothetical protein
LYRDNLVQWKQGPDLPRQPSDVGGNAPRLVALSRRPSAGSPYYRLFFASDRCRSNRVCSFSAQGLQGVRIQSVAACQKIGRPQPIGSQRRTDGRWWQAHPSMLRHSTRVGLAEAVSRFAAMRRDRSLRIARKSLMTAALRLVEPRHKTGQSQSGRRMPRCGPGSI